MIGWIEKANGVQTQLKCFRLVFQAVCLCSNTIQVFQTCVSGGLLVFKQSLSVSRWSDGLVPTVNAVG